MTRRLRIAVLNRHFGRRFGGAESYSVALVEQLAARHDLHVFAQEFDHPGLGITLHPVPRPLAKPRWLNQLWYAAWTWQATRRGFDVVHSHENTWHGDLQTVHVRPFKIGLFHDRKGLRRVLRWLSLFTSPRLLTYWWLEAGRFSPRPHRHIVATSGQVMAPGVTPAAARASDGRPGRRPGGRGPAAAGRGVRARGTRRARPRRTSSQAGSRRGVTKRRHGPSSCSPSAWTLNTPFTARYQAAQS